MTDAQSWKLMAFAQPTLVAFSASLVSDRVRYATWCHWGLRTSRLYVALTLPAIVLAAALALTFVTDAFRNARLGELAKLAWAVSLLLASPIVVPLYWFAHLRTDA